MTGANRVGPLSWIRVRLSRYVANTPAIPSTCGKRCTSGDVGGPGGNTGTRAHSGTTRKDNNLMRRSAEEHGSGVEQLFSTCKCLSAQAHKPGCSITEKVTATVSSLAGTVCTEREQCFRRKT